MFAFSSLFSAVAVAAAFDTAVQTQAANGRVPAMFATAAATEYGLPLVDKQGNPIGKPAFLKLAQAFRVNKGKGCGIKGHKKAAMMGAALDAIALALQLGAAPNDEASDEERAAYAARVATLTAAGGYLGDLAAWEAATAPAAKVAKAKPQQTQAAAEEESEAAAPAAAPAETAAPAPDVSAAFNLTLAAIKTQALTAAQCRELAAALLAAGFDVGSLTPAALAATF